MSEYDRGGSYTAEVRVCVRVSVCMYEREGDGDRRGCEPVLSPAVFCVLFSNEAKLNELSSLAFLTLIHTQQGFRECETGLYALKADSLPVCLSLLHPRKQKEIQYVLDIVWIICSNGNLDCFEMMPFFFLHAILSDVFAFQPHTMVRNLSYLLAKYPFVPPILMCCLH